MDKRLPDNLVEEFSRFVEAHMGLHFPKEKWPDLERGLQHVCREFGCDSEEAFARHAMSSNLSKRQIEMLASCLTIGETYFFREKRALDAFEEILLSEFVRTRRGAGRRLRIWSAGCSSGEEPYTIAMMLKMLIPDLKDWNISIIATDINPHFLEKAVKGIYTSWSFRDVPEGIINRFFIKKGKDFEVLQEIKEMVTFSYLNLMKDDYPSLINNTNAMDVIFCRNVLMYFSPETVKAVAQHFHRCLTDDGRLIVSQTELNDEYFKGFKKVVHSGAMLLRKSDAAIPVSAINKISEMLHKPAKKETEPVVSDTGLYDIAGKAFDNGEYSKAEEVLGRLMRSSPGDTKALSLMARICANQGRLDDALRYIEEAIKTDNMSPGRHYLHSAILKEKGLKKEAMDALKKSVYLDADFALAYYSMGNLALGSGNMAEAERHFDSALLILKKHGYDDILPESEGMTAGRLIDLIESMKWRKKERR